MNKIYDESTIRTLGSLEHIRLRSGMYVGRLGDGSHEEDGIYVMLKEIIDNSVDEFIMGAGKKIYLKIEKQQVCVRDFGRGIPFGKVVECVSVINTGAKYNTEVFQLSVGLNGVGTKAVNALSQKFLVRSIRDRRFTEAQFQQGKLLVQKNGKIDEPDGTFICFYPDKEIFGDFSFDYSFIEQRVWNYAYLNLGLVLHWNKAIYASEEGLRDFLMEKIGEEILYPICHHRSPRLEFAFTHTNMYGEGIFSFVNGQYTSDGGTHQSAFREGILRGVNEHFQKNFLGSDVREGMVAAVSVRIQDPLFESQTKNKLGNIDIRSWIMAKIQEAVMQFLLNNPQEAVKLQQKIQQNEILRKELIEVRKKAKESSKRMAFNIPNLKDCKYHRGEKGGEDSSIFITEGLSAAGSMISARDVYTQALFSLRGKPKNMYDKKKADLYETEELFRLVAALGTEHDPENLRYEKIIIATDADNDGFHIRNLLITFFLTYYEGLVMAGHVFILETPLFRVRNKQKNCYCYSEAEKEATLQQLSNAEVTRFKGLGEISPHEFGQFIGEDIRLLPVLVNSSSGLDKVLEFYMGSNTQERKDFIMENLYYAGR